jgi:hypothetical protein
MKRLSAFALCLFLVPAFAAEPKQEQPAPAPPPVAAVPKLTLPESVAVSPGEWAIVPFTSTGGAPKFYFPDPGLVRVQLDALFGDEVAAKAKALVIKTSPKTPAGRYRLVGYCGSGSVVSEVTLCEILVGDVPPPQPPPGPGPVPPGPTPPPSPVTLPLWAVVVRETADSTSAQARVIADLDMWRQVNALGVKWRVYDKDQADVKNLKLDALIAKSNVTLPALILLDAKGANYGVVPVPGDSAAMVERIKGVLPR